jgi:subtilase family serine protease
MRRLSTVALSVLVGCLSLAAGAQAASKRVCAASPARGEMTCFARVHVDSKGIPDATSAPVYGYRPADLQAAYGLASAAASNGASQTVAIVDAYNDPSAASDLASYRAAVGLPACSTSTGCFRQVNQTGGSTLPAANIGWAEEISLDLDMASAICPRCHILLVEASNANISNLLVAEDYATGHATEVSNSWGATEFSGQTSYDYHFQKALPITVSSGDSGYGVQWPASSRYVTAVGGTSLTRTTSTTRGFTETAWSGAGAGCSSYDSKPSWQHDTGCSRRTVADVSAVADPNTGVAVYDTYGTGGWLQFGGTSVAAPIIAATYALAGGFSSQSLYGSVPYAHTSALFDVRSGSDGSCSPAYLCSATTGYDGPTGLGTPTSIGAF